MNSENQSRQQGDTYMSIVLALIGAIIAWSALLVGAGAHQATDSPDPFPYWIAAGGIGLVGAQVLFTFAHPFLLLLVVLHDVIPLLLRMNGVTISHFLLGLLLCRSAACWSFRS